MAKLSQEDILVAIDGMTVLELSEFIKAFEERYGVTAAAPAPKATANTNAAPMVRRVKNRRIVNFWSCELSGSCDLSILIRKDLADQAFEVVEVIEFGGQRLP